VRTVGIDVASQPAKTATCWITWSDGQALVDDAAPVTVDDDELRRCVEQADKAGLDVPLGWPTAFVQAVAGHHRHEPWQDWPMASLQLRATDRWVSRQARRPGGPDRPGVYPLSVSTDRIGVPALRVAAALGQFDRTGAGRVVEVYPKAALYVWGLTCQGYKGSRPDQKETRVDLVSSLQSRTASWLHANNTVWDRFRASDHVLDAFVASLVARAKISGLCEENFDASSDEARDEGWIALPRPGSLELLARG
jgi:Protein of unknown function (DUF429)